MPYLMTLSGDTLVPALGPGAQFGTDFFPGSSDWHDKKLSSLVHRQLAFKNPHISRRTPRRYANQEDFSGIFSDIGDFVKGTVKFVTSPFVAATKGGIYGLMETGRAIKTIDPGRLFMAPFKGIGHTAGTNIRGVGGYSQLYWRPSKMGWMKPIGTIIGAVGLIPTPASPFLIAGGAALTGAGAIGGAVRSRQLSRQAAEDEAAQQALQSEKKANMVWLAVAGAMAVGAVVYLT